VSFDGGARRPVAPREVGDDAWLVQAIRSRALDVCRNL
jgi:hypothetical protein